MKKFISILILFLLISTLSFANTEFNYNKALAEFSRGNYKSSIELLLEISTGEYSPAEVDHLLGLNYYKLGDYAVASKFLESAKKTDPGLSNIDLDIGLSYLKADRLEKAKSAFQDAVLSDSSSGVAHYNLGYVNFLLGNYSDAVSSFGKAKSLDSNLSTKSNYYSGICHYRMSQYQASRTSFEFVLRGSPSSDMARSVEEYLKVIDSYSKKYYGTLTTGIQYDTNVGLEPEDVNIFTNENDFSGIWYVNLGYRPIFNDGGEIGIDYKGFLSLHFDITEFNIQNHRFTLFGKKKVTDNTTLYADYYYEFIFIGDSTVDELFSQTHSFKPGLSYSWNNFTSTDFTYNFRYRDFEDFPERDAFRHRWTLSQTFNMLSGRFFLVPGAAFSYNTADDVPGTRNYDYYSPEAYLDAVALFDYGLTAFFNIHYFYQDYYNDPFDREDHQLGLRVLLSKQLYQGYYLDLGYQLIKNYSDSTFPGFEPYEYTRNIFTVALSYRF